MFERQLDTNLLIDMSGLATAAQVRAGEVCVGSPSPTYPEHPRYTPQTYVLHLKNILRLMDRYKNYCFLPVPLKEQPGYNLIANESGLALLIRTGTPPLMLEIRRPEMIVALREHLLRRADAVGYDGIHREKIRMEIRALIQELGG